MRILHITNLYAPTHGGVAEACRILAKQQVAEGHKVEIWASDDVAGHPYETNPQIDVRLFRTIVKIANFHITPSLIFVARKELKYFEIIYLHNYRTFQNIVVHRFAVKNNIPYVLQAHGSLPTIHGKQLLKQLFDCLWGLSLLHDASGVIAVTRVEAKQYYQLGVAREKIEIIPHRTEVGALPSKGVFRLKYNIKPEEKVILYLGRIHKIKGLDLLIDSFAMVKREVPSAKLVIIGPNDGYLGKLKKLVKLQKLEECVLFISGLYEKEKLSAYIDSDVFVLLSKYEVFGISILEAIACGTPVVVSKECGVAEQVTEKVGLVVNRDKESVSNAIIYYLRKKGEENDKKD